MRARRIVIKGGSGAGKTTLAVELAQRLGVPHIELDAHQHGPNWKEATPDELRASVAAVLDDARGWVVDGNYERKIGTMVLDRAELVLWLDFSLPLKLRRLWGRSLRRILGRKVLWNGNRETFRGAFFGADSVIAWAIRTHFRAKRDWPPLLVGRSVVRLRTPRELELFLESI